ncbi:TIGR01621 family pseudouridine synthase [Pseudoalteromonas xiamenensis]
MQFDVVFDHNDFLIAYKPAGVSFHSEDSPGFVVMLEAQLNRKLFPVHRLDKVTSGLIVLAKHKEAAAKLTALFESRKIDKFYLALIDAKPKKKQGWVKGDMAKSRRGAFKLLKSNENPAVTRFYSQTIEPGIRAVILKPFSGKTHQLRVALKSLGAPIIGDELYAGSLSDRTYLHAYNLQFIWDGVSINCKASPVEGELFKRFLSSDVFNDWQQPNNLEW